MNKKAIEIEEKKSILFWLLSAFVVFFLFWAPFQKALFNGNTFDFERSIYTSLVWGFIVLLIASLYLFYNWKLKDHRDILTLLVWLLPFTYLLAKVSEASHYYATNMLYIQMLYAIFFILGVYLCRSKLGSQIITCSLMGSGYAVVWFGMINWLGYKEWAARMVSWFVDLPNKMEYRDAVMSAENQLRLTSTFQYANSYAAFLIALLLSAVYLMVSSKKPAVIMINAFMCVPIIISFFLTLSRGGLVILPIVLLLILPFMKISKQIFMFIYLGVSFLISLLILSKITEVGEQFYLHQNLTTAAGGLWTLIGVSAGFAIVIWLLQKYVFPILESFTESKIKMKFATILLPAAALIIGALGVFLLFGNTGATNLLPDYIKQRIENINFAQHSVLERNSFNKDALKLFEDYPILGAGGGAWAALYEKYQSYPYVSRQAHNFFMQYLVETGTVGILVLIGFLAYVFGLYIRYHIKSSDQGQDRHIFYIVTISLLIHSIIDFDLSYVFIGVLVFLSLGAMISHISLIPKSSLIKKPALTYINKIYPASLFVLSIIMFFISAQNLSANSSFQNALATANSNKSINEIFIPLDKALSIHKNQPDYSLYKIDILFQAYQQTKDENFYNQMLTLINQLKTDESNNRYLIEQEMKAYLVKEQYVKAQEIANAQTNNFSWDITLYEKTISLDLTLSEKARMERNDALKVQYWNHSFEVYAKVLSKMKELESLPKEQVQGRAFNVTRNMAFNLGQIEFIRGQYASSDSFLKTYITDQFEDAANRELARWYLAALQKQNKTDQPLYDKLIAKDPKERDEINKLVNATF
ncbi:O-antigen ligase [Paenibacillus sp. 1_12]|uniref:O-antigen ligase family protein n=1 Tax=Paenibacillus sp. 1_12 TaxID=1566278 RepID=UPI0008EF1A30|nr:O-antigen ligase family protein [Paenibacillus sp. 1_12]SFM12796.1 O-antigen ligase [Paenibacillus sp. 1_12]